MTKREPKQSQLDYLWVNFGKLTVPKEITEGTLITAEQIEERESKFVSKLTLEGSKLVGSNVNGEKLTEVSLSNLSGGSLIIGSESNSLLIEVDDGVITAKLKINNEDSSIKLIETENGLKIDDSELKEQLLLVQEVSENIAEIKEQIKKNTDALLVLNSDENTEGSVQNIINSTLQWKEI